ncbi:MAG: flagellar basal body P-ring formation chaperone FlgA [Candidatus Tectomicrobia bacterium]
MAGIRYWFTWVFCCCPVVAWAASLTISAQSAAVVQGPHITIGDIADVQADSPRTIAEIRSIIVGQSPPPGQERTLYGGYITTRLRQHGLRPQDFSIQAPTRIRVTRAFQRIESRHIEARVVDAIHANMPWKGQRTTIRALRGIQPVRLSPGSVNVEVSFPTNTDFLGPTSFTVVFRVDGNSEHRLYGTALIEVSQELVTTARPLARHHVISEADLRWTRVNLARLPRRVLMKPEDIVGKRTKRPLQANAMIHAYEVEVLPLVRKGDVVKIIVESALLQISTMGEAIENGQHGETIRVKNLSSQRELRAVVVNKKTVKVPF